MALAMMRVEQGRYRRVIVNLPPRHMKSLIVSIFYVAWRLAAWLERFLYEVATFPNIPDKDQVDSMTQIVGNIDAAIQRARLYAAHRWGNLIAYIIARRVTYR